MEQEQTQVHVRPEVKSAAKLLDKVIPGWHRKVDVQRLEMSDCNMCMLGQTFGYDAEMGIAKKLHPKKWKEAVEQVATEAVLYHSYEKPSKEDRVKIKALIKRKTLDGYDIGREFFKILAKNKEVPEDLESACEGDVNNCEWISEIADRRAEDEMAKGRGKKATAKRGRK